MAFIPKKYLRDRFVLLLLSVNIFMALFTALTTLLKLSGGRGSGYIVQYRANLGISAFKTGSVSSLLAFVGFVLIILAVHFALSARVYHIRRELAVMVLSLGLLLQACALIVSNSLLALR